MDKIFIKKDNKFLYIYTKDKKIILSTLKDGVTEENIVAENSLSDFDAAFDKDGNLNIIYFNDEQNLIFATQKNNAWIKKVLYQYKDKDFYIDNFKLWISGKMLHMLFAVHKKSIPREIMLAHQKWNENWIGNNISLIKNVSFKPFYSSAIDIDGNLHLVYITKENNYKLYYNVYTNGIWSQKLLLSESQHLSFPYIIVDSTKNIHVLWVEENIVKELRYKRKSDGGWPKGSWSNYVTLAYSDNITNPYLSIIDNNIWCTYIQNNTFFNTISSDNGISWSKPFKLPEPLSLYDFCKFIDLTNTALSNFCYVNKDGKCIPSIDTNYNIKNYEKDTYFTFYIKEVQEYLNILIKKLEATKEEKRRFEAELNKKNSELIMKNRTIHELQETIKKINEEKSKSYLKADNYSAMLNSLLSENEQLKRQIKDLQNKVILLSSKSENMQNSNTLEKIKSLFYKKAD